MRPERSALSLPFPIPETTPLAAPEGFADRLASVGAQVEPATIARLGDYLARLLAVNELMNLTAIEDPTAAWERHGLDAWTLLPLLAELEAGASVVDIGAGGGLPGIPIAIARPDLRVTLVEATQKKAAFLEVVAADLGLSNVSVRAERAEALVDLHGAFDVVTARAVARLAKLVGFTAPFAKPGGRLLLVKGQRADEELAEAKPALRAHHLTHDRTVPTPTGRIVVLHRSAPRRS